MNQGKTRERFKEACYLMQSSVVPPTTVRYICHLIIAYSFARD